MSKKSKVRITGELRKLDFIIKLNVLFKV